MTKLRNIFVVSGILISYVLIFLALNSLSCNSGKQKALTVANDSVDSIKILSAQIRSNPRQHSLFYKRALLNYGNGNLQEAVNDIEIALKLDSINPVYLHTAADYFLLLGKSERSRDALLLCIKHHPQDKEAHFKLAQLYYYVKQYDDGLKEIAFIEGMNQQSDKTYFLKALIFKENNMTVKAVESLLSVLEYNPKHAEAYNMIGMIYYEADNKLAVDYFNTAVLLFPDNLQILLNAGLVYEKFGLNDKTRQVFEKAISVDSTDYQANYNMGYYLLVYGGDVKAAIGYFSKAVEIDPKAVNAYYNRGLAYELSGNETEARNDYNKALEIAPNYDLAVEALNKLDKR